MATGGQGGGDGRGLTAHHRREIRRAVAALKARQALQARSAAYQAHGYGTAHPHPPSGGVASRRVIRSGQVVQTGLRDTPARRRPPANRNGLPADTGQSLSPPRSTRAQLAAYQRAHPQPFGPLGHLASQLAILAGSTDRVQAPPTGRRVRQSGLAPEQVDAAARAVAHSFAQDVTDPQHHKLNFGLDLLSVLSGGTGTLLRTGAAVRGYREATAGERAASALGAFSRRPTAADLPRRILPDETGLRRLRVGGGSVQVPHVSPSPLTAAMQHIADRISELAPEAPGVGANARAARHITEQNTVRLHRLTAKAIPAENTARELRSPRGVTPQQMAYTAIARYGHTGEEGGRLLDLEVQQKLADAAKVTGKARRRLVRRAQLLQKARPYVVTPTPELSAALREGHALSDVTGASRVQRGFTTPDVADQAVARHVRTVHGATFETPTPGKLGKVSVALKRKRGRVESLQQRYDKAVEKADKAGVVPKVAGVKTDAELAREEKLAEQVAQHRQALRSTPKGTDAKLQARLDEINHRWDSFVSKVGGGEGKYKTVNVDQQRAINAASRKRGRKVLSDELRRQKEQIALKFVEDNQHVPIVARVRDQLAEADRIQTELTARAERRAGIAGDVLHPHLPTTADALKHEVGRLTKEARQLALRPGRIGTSVTTEGRLLHARGTARIERLGAALSVAKDELATAEKAAAARIAPTHLVGAESVKPGPHAFFTPDAEKTPLGPSTRARVSLNPPRDRVHASTMTLFRQGREQIGPDVTIRDFRKEVRHIDRAERAKVADRLSVPYDPATFNPDVHALFDPNAAKTARELRAQGTTTSKAAIAGEKRSAMAPEQQIDLQDAMSPAQLVRRIVDDHLAWSEKAFPRRAATVAGEHQTGLRMIDRKLADAIAGNDVVQRMESSWFGKFFDFSNQVNRAGLIYLNPISYGVVQGAGNVAFLGLQQGAFVGRNIPRYVRRINQLEKGDARFVDIEVGGGAAAVLAHEGVGAGPLTRLADFDNLLADLMPRRIAWIHEADRAGFKTPAEIHALIHNEKLRPQLNTVSERAQQAMVKFQRRSTKERKIIGRAIFIAPWIEGSTRWLGRVALDHPINARVANEIRDRIFHQQVKKLGYGHLLTGSFIPVGKAYRKAGLTVIPGFDPQGASVTGSGFGALNAIGELAGLVDHPLKGGTRIAGMLQPTLGAAVTAATRHDAYSGYDYPSSRSIPSIFAEQLVGNVDRPVFPAAATLRTAFTKPTDISGEKPSKMPLKYPEAGWQDALKRALLGSARPRLIVKAALDAKSRAAQLQAMPKDKRAAVEVQQDFAGRLDELHKLGVYTDFKKWEPAYQTAINQRIARKVAYVKQNADTPYKKLLIDLKLAVKHGYDPGNARDDAKAFKTDDASTINTYRLRVQRAYLGQDALDEISGALRDAKRQKANAGG